MIKEEGLTDESSKTIEKECKNCGKKFRNLGVAYCSKDCQLMDKNWNYIEIWKCYRLGEQSLESKLKLWNIFVNICPTMYAEIWPVWSPIMLALWIAHTIHFILCS